LREILDEERIMMNDSSIKMAALDIDEEKENPEDK
jgi:hypothetical protein